MNPHLIERTRNAREAALYLREVADALPDTDPDKPKLLDAADAHENLARTLAKLGRESVAVPAHKAFDNLDGTFSTAEPNPQSQLIEMVPTDGADQLWQDDDLPTGANLTWDGKRYTVHAAKNTALFIPSYARSRNGSPQATTISFSGFTGLSVEQASARYYKARFVSFFGQSTYSEKLVALALRTVDALRRFLTRTKANKFNPAVLDDDKLTADAPATGNQMFGTDIYIPASTPTGTVTGTITATDSQGGKAEFPVDIVVRNILASDQNLTCSDDDTSIPKFNGIFGPINIGERITGNLFPNPGSDQDAIHLDWLDEFYRVARKHGFDPWSGDNRDFQGRATPVPGARKLARLNGSIFAGGNYRGASSLAWDVIGAYGDLDFHPGVDLNNNTEAQNIAAETQLCNDMNTELTNAGLTLTGIFGYTSDEAGPEEAQKRAVLYNHAQTGVLPLTTTSTTTGHLIEAAFDEAPDIRAHFGSGHVVSKFSHAAWKAQRALGKIIGQYNAILPARGSAMMEERPLNQALSFVIDAKVGNNGWFMWNGCYTYAVESFNQDFAPPGEWTPTTGPNPGIRDPKRQNLHRYAHTFGNTTGDSDDVFGRGNGQTRNSAQDGLFFIPKSDFYYADDPLIPQTFGFLVCTKAKFYREGIQTETLLAQAMDKNPTATRALLGAVGQPGGLIEKDAFSVGAGDDGNAGLTDPSRSYIGAGLPDAKVYLEDISGDDFTLFKRAVYDILEA